ncbi:MAG: hypothetical protein QF831_06135 [Candidatus Thalassarchaeaceae archaeon]|jgi:hypothetical protein|nr:hypothetical protein [Candidatus Thalassarchaeaceae archaeon]
MELSEVTMWAVVAALVAIPLCYYFWRRWDRPSVEAKAEQEFRLKERETREIFQREEAKAREHERQQALVQLRERKKSSVVAPSSVAVSFALSNLDAAETSNNVVVASIPEIERSEEEIALLEQIPETIAVPDIEPDEYVADILEDEGPVSLKVGIMIPEEVKSESEPVSLDADFEWPEWE